MGLVNTLTVAKHKETKIPWLKEDHPIIETGSAVVMMHADGPDPYPEEHG